MNDGPRGLVVSDCFLEYLQNFRERYPLDMDLAEKYGLPTGNGRFYRQMTRNPRSGSYRGSA